VIHVIFTWYPKAAGGKQAVFYTSMPQVPAPNDTVHVPVDPTNRTGDGEDTIALRVYHVSWCDDESVPGGWHAEVALLT
jgi:hypothetical protein